VTSSRFDDEALWGNDPVPVSSSRDAAWLLEGLTQPQRDAVTHRGGPLLIVAGAGSGKTRVLTRRVAHLMATGDARSAEILAITFTNKAAQEMKTRVRDLVGPDADRMWVATFHSACLRMLRAHAEVLGYERGFTIYDAGDAETAVERIMKELGIDTKRVSPRSVYAAISGAKNEMMTPAEYANAGHGGSDPQRQRVAEVFRLYDARLLQANAMDFDDLLLNAVRMLRFDREVLEGYRRRFRHVLVDEFQDTNGVQNELVTMLAEEHRDICVVGDSDQSIYRFRAADIRNILLFSERFSDATTIMLEQNFRSTQVILDAANAVISQNTARHPKRLFTEGSPGDKIRRYRAQDEYDEARWVASEVRRFRDVQGLQWSDMAVFYRTNAASRVLEEEMLRAGVAYRVISGQRFYERKEIKNALAYARLIVNPRDEASARRVINEPKRGVGDVAQGKISRFGAERNLSFAEAVGYAQEAGLTGKALTGATEFFATLEQLRALNNDLPPGEMIEAIIRETGIEETLLADHSDEAKGRLENLGELASAASQYETLLEFVEQMSLVSESDHLDDAAGTVSLMTIHVAKGLEFPAVIITGLEEGNFPHSRAMDNPEELEEERRLCYVAITRAMKFLSVTHAWTRTRWGQHQDNIESRFFREIPEKLINDLASTAPVRRSSFRDEDHGFEGRGGSFSEGRAIGAGTAPPARSTGAELLGLVAGERVIHDRYGMGTVQTVSGSGPRTRATVSFDNFGDKQLVLSLTPLRRAE
jgi:DNA helicase-2/ATP-dependent DNA helicase PcrA